MSIYCLSDIHGHLAAYKAFRETINKNDTVYILGDVIDKGPSSIELLLEILNDSQCIMLLGNHEYMMYQFLKSDINDHSYIIKYDSWLNHNHGRPTYESYLSLNKEERDYIISKIENLPLCLPDVLVNERHYYLTHSYPYKNEKMILKDSDENIVDSFIWQRVDVNDFNSPFHDKVIIGGHTPVQLYGIKERPAYKGNDIKYASYIDIDGGLAGAFSAKLIALCLDDLTYRIY